MLYAIRLSYGTDNYRYDLSLPAEAYKQITADLGGTFVVVAAKRIAQGAQLVDVLL